MNTSNRYVFKKKWKRFAAACFDSAGWLFFKFLRRPLSINPPAIRKILAIRLDHLGDAVMIRPALYALHQAFPTAQIDLLISKDIAALFEEEREVRQILTFDPGWFSQKKSSTRKWDDKNELLQKIKHEQYDLAIDFRGDLRIAMLMWKAGISHRFGYGTTGGSFLLTHCGRYSRERHQVELNFRLLEPLGITWPALISSEPFSYSGSKKAEFWTTNGKSLDPNAKHRIIIHPGAGYPSKRWPVENYQTLIKEIINHDLGQIILIGTEEEKKLLPVVQHPKIADLRGRTSLSELPILFDACDLYIGNDSGPAHVAASQNLELISLFSGTNDAKVWHPWTNRLHLIQHEVPCSPCESKECPLGHHHCMTGIEPMDVLNVVKKVLQ